MKGYTILEAIVAVAIFVVILATAAPFLRVTHRTWGTDKRLNTIVQDARAALDKITEELKYTNEIIAIDANTVTFGTSGEEYYLDDKNAGHRRTSGV